MRAAALVSAVWLGAHQAMACVGCREPGSDTIASEPQTVLAGFGFSWGVLILLGFALAMVGGLVGYICVTVVRIERERG